jgi:hypothetical protein
MNCGHRGKPKRDEERRISRLLRKACFIPLPDDYFNKNGTDVELRESPNKRSSGASNFSLK